MPDLVAGPRTAGAVTVVMNRGLGADTFRGIELLGGTFNRQDIVTGRLTDGPADAAEGSALYLSLYGGNDIVQQTPLGAQQTWADGLYVGYSWSATGITVNYVGATATVSYGAAGSQLAGTDTLTHVTLLDDSKYNDYFDLSGATLNAMGYITDPLRGKSSHTLLMGWGGSDTVVGNGQTTLYYGTVNATNNGNGISIDLRADQADLSNLSTSGIALGLLSFSGIRGVLGTRFNDALIGGRADNDALERFRGDAGNDLIDGGRGLDLAIYSNALEGVNADLAQGTVQSTSVGSDTLRGIESLSLTSLNDVVDASSFGQDGTPNQGYTWWGYNQISPRGGDDSIIGNGSTVLDYEQSLVAIQADLAAGVADARVESDKLTDPYRSMGRDTFSGVYAVRGSQYDDLLVGGGAGRAATGIPLESFQGGAGNDTMDGVAGYDAVTYLSSPNAIVVDLSLATGQVQDGWGFVDTLLNIDELNASNLDDSIRGSAAEEHFAGRKGQDSIDGAGGYDEVGYWESQAGVTVLLHGWVGSTGSLSAGFTGSASDGWGTIDVFRNVEGVEGSPYNDSIVGDAGANRLDGRGGVDTIDGGAGIDWVEYNQAMQGVRVDLSAGMASDDGQGTGDEAQSARIETDLLRNIEHVLGGYGADSITGDAHDNKLMGGAGADTLAGGAGRDTLEGESGDDLLTGGAGSDTFIVSSGQDTVNDFAAGDVIRVAGLSLTGPLSLGTGLGLAQSQVHLQSLGTSTRLHFGIDSIAGADLTVTLEGAFSIAQLEVADGAVQFVNPPPDCSSQLLGGAQEDRGLAIASAASGPLYIGGMIGGALSASSFASSLGGSPDASGGLFVSMLASNSSAQWTRPLTGWQVNSPLVIAPTAAGVVAAGTISHSSSGLDAVVRAFDANGSVLWTHDIASPLNRPGSTDVAHGVDVNGSGEVLVVGMTDGALQGQTSPSSGLPDTDIFVRKLDASGNALWTTALVSEGTEWEIAGIRSGLDGRIYVAGSTYGNLGGETNQGVRDAFVTCLDAQGQVLWTRLIGNDNYDDAVDIEVAADGSIWVSGLTYGQLGSNAQQGQTDGFLTRLTPDGTVLWTQTYGGAAYDGITAITPMVDGVLAVMDIYEQQPAGSGPWVQRNELVRIDGAGQAIWRDAFEARIAETTLAADGRVHLIGSTAGPFGGVTGLGQGDVFMTRVDFNRAPTGAVTLSGVPTLGETLTASHTLVDLDGIPASGADAIRYTWLANGTSLPGASGSSYTLTRAEIGKTISVVASYVDEQGHSESIQSAATAPVSAGPGGVNLSGQVYHWKSHMLLSGVEIEIASSEATRTDLPPAVLDLRGLSIQEDAASGNKTVSVQVWANALAGDANFDFKVGAAEAVSASFVSALSSGWTVLANTASPAAIMVAGFDSGAGMSQGPVQLGTLQLVYGPGSQEFDALFSEISVGSTSGLGLALTAASDTTDAQGSWSVSGLPTGSYRVSATRDVTDAGNAITSADALAALRIAVGLNPNADPDGAGPLSPARVSPYQLISADANGSGTVTSADALAILRMAVKLPTALPAEWFFVEEGRDFWDEGSNAYNLSRTAASWDRSIEISLMSDTTSNLVGMLKGDVNGSWSAPAGSVDLDTLDPNYFTNLATRMAVPTDQWGV
ncbi:MAG: hypothetical protein RLZ51_2363, partial [Pseudomonadota bacterium]